MKCPKCSSQVYVKSGFIYNKQRYLCKHCNCKFTKSYIGRYTQNIKLQALKLYKEGNGFRRIGRILGVSFETVRLWILNISQYIKPSLQNNEYDVVEVDELCTFLKTEKIKDGYGLLIIAVQNKFLTTKLDVEVTKQVESYLKD
jgi:transposase-like protein